MNEPDNAGVGYAVVGPENPYMGVPSVVPTSVPRPMPKQARTSMRSWAERHLVTKQNNLCPLCGLHIDLRIKGEGVTDHDHLTGEIRGILHRSCNAAEGKIANAAARWGAKSTDPQAVRKYLRALLAYYEMPGAGVVYALHKTADDKKDARNAKAKLARAKAKAIVALRSRKVEV